MFLQTNLTGKTILGYTVTEVLGAGAFGTVYKVVKDNPAGRYVRALKHITIPTEKQYMSVLNSMGGDVSKADSYFSEMLQSIVSEIKILNDLSEKGVQHIVRYYENDITSVDSPRRYDVYILMEYLTPLDDYIQKQGFSVADVIRLGEDILKGLKACHDNGVIHRDIKDDNIFVSDKGEFKIGDFGVSKVLKDSSKAESLKGTPNFLAPEVYLGREGYTKSVDLYSLGIVLYRLLNYSRNPFLPHYPEQFYSQDEDSAFEARMSGKIPDLPSLGGEQIGKVIVRAISGREQRFQTAEEFLGALEYAKANTPPDILGQKIGFEIHPREDTFSDDVMPEEYGETIAETVSQENVEKPDTRERDSSINRHLFESIGEMQDNRVPDVEPAVGPEHDKKEKKKTERSVPPRGGMNVPPVSPGKEAGIKPPTKKSSETVVFLIPVILLLIGLIAYLLIIPNLFGRAVSFIDWLFSGTEMIGLKALNEIGLFFPSVGSIVIVKLWTWLWLAAFITSLFFAGRQLQKKPEPDKTNSILTKKEPYLMIQDVSAALKMIKKQRNDNKLDALIYAVKSLEDKLFVESDFGYGDSNVINCENNIARQLQFLVEAAPDVEFGNIDENISRLNKAVMNINSLLRRRTELKKK